MTSPDLRGFRPPLTGCPATPLPGCFAAGKTGFKLKNSTDDTKDQLKWKWKKGVLAAAQATFGDPVDGGTSYKLCIYDTSGGVPALKRGMVVDAGGTCGIAPCWKAIGDKGWKYKNSAGNADGVTNVLLKGGDTGKPTVLLKARGADLEPPAPLSGSEYFDVDTEVVVQWHSSNPLNCWSQSYGISNVTKNDGVQFNAKTP